MYVCIYWIVLCIARIHFLVGVFSVRTSDVGRATSNYRILVGFGRFALPLFSLTKKLGGGVVQTSEIISSFHFPVVFFVEAVTFQMNAGKNPSPWY